MTFMPLIVGATLTFIRHTESKSRTQQLGHCQSLADKHQVAVYLQVNGEPQSGDKGTRTKFKASGTQQTA
jgi:hypothetical protein